MLEHENGLLMVHGPTLGHAPGRAVMGKKEENDRDVKQKQDGHNDIRLIFGRSIVIIR